VDAGEEDVHAGRGEGVTAHGQDLGPPVRPAMTSGDLPSHPLVCEPKPTLVR